MFSSIWGGIKSLYNTVKSAFSSIPKSSLTAGVGNIQLPKSTSTTSNVSSTKGTIVPQVYPGSTGQGSSQNVSTGDYTYTPTVKSNGSNVPFYGPVNLKSKPISFSSGSSISNRTVSDYSSPSYSGDVFAGSPQQTYNSSINVSANTPGAGTSTYQTPTQPSPATGVRGQTVDRNVALGADPTTGLFPTMAGQEEVSKEKTNRQMFDDYIASLKKPESTAELYKQAKEESGIEQARQQKNITQNKINAITSQLQADTLRYDKMISESGGTLRGFGGVQAEIEREAAIKLLPLQAQLAVDQGNLEIAETNMNTLFSMYVKDAENSTKFYNDNVQRNWDFFTKEEQNKLTEISKQKDFENGLIKDRINDHRDFVLQAYKDGNSALASKLANIRPPTNSSSPTYTQDIANYEKDVANTIKSYAPQGTKGGIDTTGLSSEVAELANVSQNLASKFSSKFSQDQFLSNVNRLAKSGDTGQLADYVFSEAISNISDTDTRKKAFGNYRVVKQLSMLENQLANYEAGGGNTNLLIGKKENVLAKLGTVQDVKLREIGTAITNTLDELARARTGAVISESEERMYRQILPGIDKTGTLNKAIISGLNSSLTNDIDSILKFQLTGSGFDTISKYLKPKDTIGAKLQIIDLGKNNPTLQTQIKTLMSTNDPALGRPLDYDEVLQVLNSK